MARLGFLVVQKSHRSLAPKSSNPSKPETRHNHPPFGSWIATRAFVGARNKGTCVCQYSAPSLTTDRAVQSKVADGEVS